MNTQSLQNRISPLLLLTALLASGVSMFSNAAHAFECKNTVDSTKALIFIDLNFGLTEIHAAEQAACDRGETFVRIPGVIEGEESAHQDLVRLTSTTNRIENLRAEAKKIKCALPLTSPEGSVEEGTEADDSSESADRGASGTTPSDPRCDQMIKTFASLSNDSDRLTTSLEAFVRKVKDANGGDAFIDDAVKKGLSVLAEQGVRPSAIILSGHSNGRAIGGRYGGIELATVQKLITDAYAGAKNLLADLKAVYLWGCNTLNPYAPEKWISAFPTLNLIVGFQGSAPSNLNAASWTVLDGFLHQESDITSAAPTLSTAEAVKARLTQIPNITSTVAAVYLYDREHDQKWFYERVRETTESNDTRWLIRVSPLLSAKDCAPVADQIKADQAYIESILAGITPIPEETGSGPLREAYTRSRRNDICRAVLGYEQSADRISMLLFWHDVKKNAVRALNPDTVALESAYRSMTEDPARFSSLVATANSDNTKSVAAQKIDLETKRSNAQMILRVNRSQLSATLVGESLLPWTKQRRRELRHLFRREKLLKRKLAKGKNEVSDALGTVSQDIRNYLEAKRIAANGGKAETQKYSDTIEKWEGLLKQYEDFLADLPIKAAPADAASLLAELRTFYSSVAPKTVAEIAPLSYADVRNLHLARKASLERINQVVGKSPALSKAMDPLLSPMRTWQKRFGQTAITPETECMEFFSWHEYIENMPVKSQPRLSCHYTI